MSNFQDMKGWLKERFPVDGQGENAWTIAESEAAEFRATAYEPIPPYAVDQNFLNNLYYYQQSIKTEDLPKQPETSSLISQFCGGYAATRLIAVDESIRKTLPSGETSPLAVTLEWYNGEDGGPYNLGLLGKRISFSSLAAARDAIDAERWLDIEYERAVQPTGNFRLYPSLSRAPVIAHKYNEFDYSRRISYLSDRGEEEVNRIQKRDNWVPMSDAGINAMFEHFRRLKIVDARYVNPH